MLDAAKQPAQAQLELRRNQDGTLDEIVASGADIHLEQMSSHHWWLGIEKDGRMIHINLYSRHKIKAAMEEQR